MRKYILLLVLLFGILSANAQSREGTFSIIPKVGVSIGKLTNDMLFVGSGANARECKSLCRGGFTGGIDTEYQITSILSCSAGVFYSQLGTRYENNFVDGQTSGEGYDNNKLILDYFMVPLTANVYVAEGLALKAGVQLGWLLDSKQSFNITPYTISKTGLKTYGTTLKYKYDFDDECNKFNLSIPVGLSYEYANVVLDVRYNIALTKTYKDFINDCRNSACTFTVGYKFDL